MDVGLSAVVFLIALIFLLSLWNIYARQLQETTIRGEMELLTFQIMDLLVTTPGVPNNWEELNGLGSQAGGDGIYVLGLAPKDRSLSKAKINKFFSLNYEDVKKYLNVERYELSFSLSYINGTVLNQTISPQSNESTQQTSVIRLVMDGNEPRQAQLMLWGK